MFRKQVHIHIGLLLTTGALTCIGLITLFSASLGSGALAGKTIFVQSLGVFIGICCIYGSLYIKKFDYRSLYKRNYALYFLGLSLLVQLFVFSTLGLSRNGATRWIDLGFTTFQPSEILKVAIILTLAFLLVAYRKHLQELRVSVGIVVSTLGVFSLLMLIIRDKGSIIITAFAVGAMLLSSKMPIKYIAMMCVGGICVLGSYVWFFSAEEYAQERISSYLGISANPLTQDYQTDQAIITIGSGELFGKGLGQSLQKHQYLPEPITDSIFAVYAEEWGFVGSIVLIVLYMLFLWFGLAIAREAKTEYGRYIVIGLVVMIVAQSFFNIMALVRLVPLSGMPLVFMSKGGTSILTSLCMVALILNVAVISSHRKTNRVLRT